jgi:hypothetical protein
VAGPASAQALFLPHSLAPQSNELAGASIVPLMTAASRMQVLYDEGELNGRSQLVVQSVSVRFDGPTGGTARTHVLERLTLLLGATGMSTAAAGSVFAANLTQPLTAALRDARVNYASDGNAVPGPEPFGGASGQLTFLLPQPVAVAVPVGGALALELRCEGNGNASDSAQLDLFIDPANFQNAGAATTVGRGCPLGTALPGPVLDTIGSYEPGGSITLLGHRFAPNTPVAILVTAHLFQNPLAFPNTTPTCWAYVDPGSTLLTVLTNSSSGGEVRGGTPVPIPKLPPPAGAVLYVQSATPVAPFSGNGFGVASSNYRTVQIGSRKQPTAGAWVAASPADARASVASVAFYGALALRLE